MLLVAVSLIVQVSLSKGTSKKWDHAQLVSAHWLMAAVGRMAVFVRHVGTHDNIADLPSRIDYRLFNWLGAEFIAPRLDPRFLTAEAWNILQVRWAGQRQPES